MDLDLLVLPKTTEEWNTWLDQAAQRNPANPSRLSFVTITGSLLQPVNRGGVRHFTKRLGPITIALCGSGVTWDDLPVVRTCPACSDRACALKVA